MDNFEWLNKEARTFLSRGYLLKGQTAEERIRAIANRFEELDGTKGIGNKFYRYMGQGFYSLASPVWSNYGLDRGLPVSCLTGDSWINTEHEGGTQIQDLKIGDKVLTHKGRYRKVVDIQTRMSKNDLFRLKVQTRKTPIKITGNHPVLTNLGWIRVDELDSNIHYIATNQDIEHLPKEYTFEFENVKTDEANTGRFSATQCCDSEITDDLAWALGLWFAEGSRSSNSKKEINGLRITMGVPYQQSVDRWIEIMTDSFGINGSTYESSVNRHGKDHSWINGNVHSVQLGRKFEEEFGRGCKDKNIPLWLKELPVSKLKAFFEGFYLGDGQKTKRSKYITIANPKLAMSLYEIGLRCGYRMGLQMQEKAGKLSTTRYVYRVNIYCDQGKVNLSVNNAKAGIKFSDGNRYCPFTLEKIDGNELVYDITVEEDHSFSVSGVVVHNCFGSYIDDTMESILYGHAENGMLMKGGGGTSGYFGALRGRGSKIKNNGESSGAVHFMTLYDQLASVVSQGSVRRGFFSAYLPIEHRDADEFLDIGTEGNPIQGLTTGITVTDKFLKKVKDGDGDARRLWAKVLQRRSEIGFPYILFVDNVNKGKPQIYKDLGMDIYASNMCMIGSDRVLTSDGYFTAKDLHDKGGKLLLFNGDIPVESSEMMLKEKDADVYKITLQGGLDHTVTDYHGIPVLDEKGNIKRVECRNLKLGDRIPVQTNKGFFGKKNMPKEAFLLGLYQSDGTQHKDQVMIDVWENDFDLITEIQESFNYIHNHYNCDTYETTNQHGDTFTRGRKPAQFFDCKIPNGDVAKKRLSSKTLKKALNFEKGYIPDWIWESNEETQWQYIRGLLYADGSAGLSDSSYGSPIHITYTEINKEFVKDLQLLFNNLGLKSYINTMREEGEQLLPDGKGGKRYYHTNKIYRLIVSNKTGALEIEKNTGFLSRKGIEIENREYRDNTKKYRKIISIEYAGKEDVYCPTINNDEHIFIAQGMKTFNCSEIALPSSNDETFTCVLSSYNVAQWDRIVKSGAIEVLIRFLDTVVEEFIQKTENMEYHKRAHTFAKRHRALGAGILGWHSYLQSKMWSFESREAAQKNLEIIKTIRERAEEASAELAKEKGEPEVLKGHGRRNTTLLAVAPTKSSSFILGQVSQSIEPEFSNCYVKDLAKSKTTIKNPYLLKILKDKKKNTDEIWDSIKNHDGSVQHLDFLSDDEKEVFKTFAEINPNAIIDQAAARQAYIDQAQSLNLLMDPDMSVKDINALYLRAWEFGVKSLYYQYSMSKAQALSRKKVMNTDCMACEG